MIRGLRLSILVLCLCLPGMAQQYDDSTQAWQPVEHVFNDTAMVLVPAGQFVMGHDAAEPDERPTSRQVFERAFWIDRTEVTREAYQVCIDAGQCTTPAESTYAYRPEQPVNRVTWYQAATYCYWREARLPSEAEWEYAARGPENLTYPWGHGFNSSLANFGLRYGETTDVGTFPEGASWVGALDLAGNVWEWTRSRYQAYPYQDEPNRNIDDLNLRPEQLMVLRGGSIFYTAYVQRSSNRFEVTPGFTSHLFGFRCARNAW